MAKPQPAGKISSGVEGSVRSIPPTAVAAESGVNRAFIHVQESPVPKYPRAQALKAQTLNPKP